MTKTTDNMGLPYPEPTDNTETWLYWQNLAEGVDAWMGPRARATLTTAQSIPTGTDTAVKWNQAVYQSPETMWTTGDATHMIAPVAGVYALSCFVGFASATSPAGQRNLYLTYNDGSRIAVVNSPGMTAGGNLALSADAELAAGDKITAIVYQSQGAALNISTGAFTMRLVGAPTGDPLALVSPQGFTGAQDLGE